MHTTIEAALAIAWVCSGLFFSFIVELYFERRFANPRFAPFGWDTTFVSMIIGPFTFIPTVIFMTEGNKWKDLKRTK